MALNTDSCDAAGLDMVSVHHIKQLTHTHLWQCKLLSVTAVTVSIISAVMLMDWTWYQ